MTPRLEKLLIRVELIDKLTGPANKVTSTFNKMTSGVASGYQKIVGGTAGIWGVSYALDGIRHSAQEMNDTMDEMASLGLTDSAMKRLQKSGIKFSETYGTSAIEFVRSAYTVQNRINDISGKELARFTEVGNLMAQGLKAPVETMTGYISDMYGKYQESADAMGRNNWVQKLAAQTTLAAEISGRSGDNMPQALGALGAAGTANKIAIEEQMGVLANLQKYMDGASAGTKYIAFLKNVAGAQNDLGLKFVDSAGKLLPITDILGKIQKKYGQIDTAAKVELMQKAFGKGSQVATLLSKDVSKLKSNIAELGQVSSLDHLTSRAKAMADPFSRITSATTALKIAFGGLVISALEPLYLSLTETIIKLESWVNMFPHLTGLIVNVMLIIFAFTAAVSLLSIAKGVWVIAATGVNTTLALLRMTLLPFGPLLAATRMAWLVFNMQMAAGVGVMGSLRAALVAFRVQLVVSTMATWAVRAALWSYNATVFLVTTGMKFLRLSFAAARMTMLATALVYPVLGAGMAALATGFTTATTASWAFAAALFANPITWIVLGVVALVAGLVLLVTHWDEVKTAAVGFVMGFMDKWHQFRAAIEDNPVYKFLFMPLLLMVDGVSYLLSHLDKIPQWFESFKNFLSALDPFALIGKGVDWLIEKLNMIPGVNIGGDKTVIGDTLAATSDFENARGAFSDRVNSATQMGSLEAPVINAVTRVSDVGNSKIHLRDNLTRTSEVGSSKIASNDNVIRTSGIGSSNHFANDKAVSAGQVGSSALSAPVAVTDQLDTNIDRQRVAVAPSPAQRVALRVPPGGISSQINNNTTNRGLTIGKVEVNAHQPLNGKSFADQLQMLAP